mmetsp:Transcript_25217/g.59791  ORF Transcript_25217/g.59791 Transcript_25217/m.59791 type:complete len:161 (+) Transcript_25217:70-552(+)
MAIIGLDSAQQRRQLMAVAGAAWLLVLVTLMAVAEDFSDEPKPMELMQGSRLRALPQRLQQLDYINKVTSENPSGGPGYEEGTVPFGLQGAICDHMYCPMEGQGIELNPDVVPTSPYAVKWHTFGWDNYDDDVSVYQPSPCVEKHLAPIDKSGPEPCDGW